MCFTLTRLRMMIGEPNLCSIWSKCRAATWAYGSAWSTEKEVKLINIKCLCFVCVFVGMMHVWQQED